jgi:glycosyltransferase involved in cell wall biosynthesis
LNDAGCPFFSNKVPPAATASHGALHSVVLSTAQFEEIAMKIAVIGSKGLPPKQGGIEHHCAEVYPRMVAQGHSVDLFGRSRYTGHSGFTQYDYKGIKVTSLPCPQSGGLDAIISSAWGAILASRQDYDIIHFHALGPALFSWLPRLVSPAKVIVTCHGLDWQRAKWGRAARSSILLGEKVGVTCADALIVVSEALQEYFADTYDRDSVYLPNAPADYGVSDPSFARIKAQGLEPGRYIIFLGRLVPEKCPELLIQAFQQLQPAGWKLVLVGGCDDESFKLRLQDYATANPHIRFSGELSGDRLAEMMRGAGLCVLPSNLEGLPMAMLEAMAEGIPIVASDIPPHRQLLNDHRGLMFRKGDVSSCIEVIRSALEHPERCRAMADRAQLYVQSHYNWDRITAKCVELYCSVQKQPAPLLPTEAMPIGLSQPTLSLRETRLFEYIKEESPLVQDGAATQTSVTVPLLTAEGSSPLELNQSVPRTPAQFAEP